MTGKRVLVITALVLLAGLLVGSMAVAAAPPSAAEWTHVVNAWLGLRMRSGPSLTDPITLVLYNGEDVRVKGDPIWSQGIRWSNVTAERRAGTFEGWVASAYLANYPGYEEPTGWFEGEGYKVVSSIGLRLRERPGLNTRVVRIVPYGTILEATGACDRYVNGLWWREFYLNDGVVWAAVRHMRTLDDEALELNPCPVTPAVWWPQPTPEPTPEEPPEENGNGYENGNGNGEGDGNNLVP